MIDDKEGSLEESELEQVDGGVQWEVLQSSNSGTGAAAVYAARLCGGSNTCLAMQGLE